MKDLLREAFECVYEIERLLSKVSARLEEGGNIADEWPNVIHGAGGGVDNGFTGV